MTKLYASIEQFEDGQDDRKKKMSRIDLAIKNLEDEKATLVKEYDSAAESITKLENKRKKLESFLEAFAAKSKQKTAVLEMEIKDLKEQLNSNARKEISTSVEVKIKPNPELLQLSTVKSKSWRKSWSVQFVSSWQPITSTNVMTTIL